MHFRLNTPEIAREVSDEEAAVVLMGDNCYYSLNRVGAEVWSLIGHGADSDAIVATMARRYRTPAGEVHAAVETLLTDLEGEGLITAAEAHTGFAPLEPAGAPAAWSPPRLCRYTVPEDPLLRIPPADQAVS